MQKLASVATVALALFSGAALAEQGSGQLNQIDMPTSSADHSHSELTMTPADLTALNGDDAKNQLLETSLDSKETVAGHHASAELTSVNS